MDPLRISLFAFLVLTVSRIHEHFALLRQGRPVLLLFLAIVAFGLMNPRLLALERTLATWPARVVAALGVLACCSALFGISLGNSAYAILNYYSRTLIFAFLLFAVLTSARDLRSFVWAYVMAGATLVWLATFVFAPYRQGSLVLRLQRLYTYDSNDLGCVLMVALPLTLWMFQTSRGWRKAFTAALIAALVVTIARTGSRGAFLGLAAVVLSLLVFVDRVSVVKRLGIAAAVGIALVLGAPEGYWAQMSTLQDPKADYNWSAVDGRRQIAERGVGYMLSYPFFGVGMGNFQKADISSKVELAREGRIRKLRLVAPHNSFVQVGAEMGVTGLLLWCSLVLGGVVAMLKLRKRLPPSWRHGTGDQRFLYYGTAYIAIALVGFAATSFFVSFAYMDPIYILAAFMAGMYAAVRRERVQSVVT